MVSVLASQYAFPYDTDFPSCVEKKRKITLVVCLVAADLLTPEVRTRPWPFEQGAVVAMPEAAMHKDDCPVTGKDDVRLPGKVSGMEAEAETRTVHKASDDNFGLGILSPDPCHHATACRAVYIVAH
jgi:hypothetical protein